MWWDSGKCTKSSHFRKLESNEEVTCEVEEIIKLEFRKKNVETTEKTNKTKRLVL